ncbi:MAG: ribosome biogenesis GTPase YlqF [Methylomicrobium sp.]
MAIQWYPGHMHKAGNEIKEIAPEVDLFIEILDARIPFSSENPLLARLRGAKPCIKILNKSDLADPDTTQHWQAYLEQEQGVKTLALGIEQTDKARQIKELCKKLLGIDATDNRLVQALIVGIPNVGKSTLINALAGRAIAKTGNEPAVTKNRQRIAIGDHIVLHDTPGMLWPNVENKNSGYRLAATGAIKDTAIEHDDIALFVAEFLSKQYPDNLKQRYKLDALPDNALQILEAIGKARGCLRSGGRVDLDKASKIVLSELRSGALGQISLETPDMMRRELAELAVIKEQKAAKKLARQQKRR